MKVLEIDYDKYIYPEGVSTPEEFADYLLSHTGKFIPMRYYTTDHCRDPFFVESDTAVKYINPAMVTVFRECEVTVLSREEYDRRLAEKVEEKCAGCAKYIRNGGDCGSNISEELSLDGYCWNYESKG